ncbi:hypothetical protein [Nocardia transvalensis]|uniref:hypothetical protein n=1 Tax=Nocardia transvalensis TaxID=37333 RepID=UPI001895501B|nr:hypothetical protein [Nocardia transvalensis]MBF6328593.1 hypothetical protein [Nocardia transvalensis]
MNRFVTIATLIAAASMVGIGAWCRIDPGNFARWANWTDHEHFLHDAGVFQIGIGLMMIAALLWRDVVAVVLGGFLIANTLHAFNHAVDHGGGHSSDPWSLLAFSVLAALALVVRLRVLRRRTAPAAVPEA